LAGEVAAMKHPCPPPSAVPAEGEVETDSTIRSSGTLSSPTVTDFTKVPPKADPEPVLTAAPSNAEPEKVME